MATMNGSTGERHPRTRRQAAISKDRNMTIRRRVFIAPYHSIIGARCAYSMLVQRNQAHSDWASTHVRLRK